MSEAEVFQLLGLVFAAAGLGMLVNSVFYSRMTGELGQSPIIVYIGGIGRIVLGYLLIRYYTYWGWDWRLILTLFGWLALIAGVLIVVAPEYFIGLATRMTRSPKTIKVFAAAATVVGVLLMVLGFFVV